MLPNPIKHITSTNITLNNSLVDEEALGVMAVNLAGCEIGFVTTGISTVGRTIVSCGSTEPSLRRSKREPSSKQNLKEVSA